MSNSVIEFLCPNGHRIRCQAAQAGRAARCPRCGVKFRVPESEDLETLEPIDSDSNISRPEFTDSDFAGKIKIADNIQQEEQIEFLCPNGHRLHGPTSLQGRPGQCPECGSRFRIPTYEEIPIEEEAERRIGLGRADGGDSSPGTLPARMPNHISLNASPVPERTMAACVARLWQIRPNGAKLELRLRDAETLVVDRFLQRLSQQTGQGAFMVRQPDGTLSVVAIPWESIVQASVHGLKDLPNELAE